MHDWHDDIGLGADVDLGDDIYLSDDALNGPEALDRALARLAAEDERLMPSAALQARTLAAWDREQARPARRRPSRWLPAVAGLSAAAAVVLALVLPRPRPAPHPIRPQQQDDTAVVAVSRPLPSREAAASMPNVGLMPNVGSTPNAQSIPVVASRPIVMSTPIGTARRARRQPTAPTPPTPHPGASDTLRFVPLAPDAARELEPGFQLARVRVPRRVLADLGVLADVHRIVAADDGGRRATRAAGDGVATRGDLFSVGTLDDGDAGHDAGFDDDIEADVAFGQDGQARAIRLVPVVQRD